MGLQESESVTVFKLRDITFLEKEFPKTGEISQDLSVFELETHTY